jgi:hypothetical protein
VWSYPAVASTTLGVGIVVVVRAVYLSVVL